MERIKTDILIAGGGIAGLLASAVLAEIGFDVICADPVPPVVDGNAAGADIRSTAFLMPSVNLLERAGLWPRLAAHAAPLRVMRIIDASGADGALETADFVSDDINQPAFAYNLPNWLIRREVLAHLQTRANAQLLAPCRVEGMLARSTEALVTLSGNRQVRAPLVIAADGRNSPLREAAGIAAKQWSYGQKALVFVVAHPDLPHENVSTEVHKSGGPFTLVPLPDAHQSAVVWMDTGPEIATLSALDDAGFSQAATARSAGVLGALTLVGRRATWPIIAQQAAQLNGARLALLAEAAHVIPPIGAQGLNMSLADLGALAKLLAAARDAGQNIGAPALLARYSRARTPDMAARIAGVDMLNRASMASAAPLHSLRRQGLKLLHGVKPLRKAAMMAGLGASAKPAR
ncbi:MAG: FAD-dependent monooxygenase [Paracoccaceae bacterium]